MVVLPYVRSVQGMLLGLWPICSQNREGDSDCGSPLSAINPHQIYCVDLQPTELTDQRSSAKGEICSGALPGATNTTMSAGPVIITTVRSADSEYAAPVNEQPS